MITQATPDLASLETVARFIQLSLTPVFLLSALASLLSVFATRLARVADRVDQLVMLLETAGPETAHRLTDELHYQRTRTLMLDIAVVLGALGGALTGGSVLALFIGGLMRAPVGGLLFALFGCAIVAAVAALGAFVCEMLLSSWGVRRRSLAPPSTESERSRGSNLST